MEQQRKYTFSTKKYQEAFKCFDRALNINPRYTAAWNNKGSTLDQLELHEEAIKCFDKALEFNPNFASAWSNKGGCLKALGNPKEALVC